MSIAYGASDTLSGIATDGLIFYLHPALSGGISDQRDGQICVLNSGVVLDKENECFDFDGSTGCIATNRVYVNDGTYTLSSSANNYTLEAWIYVRTSQGGTTDADSIVGNNGATGVGMQVGISSSLPRINFGARSTSNFYSSLLQYNQWYHIVWSHDHGVSDKTYINGVLDVDNGATTSYAIATSDLQNMSIGNSSPRVTGYYDGLMGPIRIYNRGITQEEVTQNFNASKARYGL